MPTHRIEFEIKNFNNKEEMRDIKKEYDSIIEKKEKNI